MTAFFDRSRSKKVELLARVFDHCSMKYRSGFRLLTLGWSDGNSFLPVSHGLLSAADDKNLLCGGKPYDAGPLQEGDAARHGGKPQMLWWS